MVSDKTQAMGITESHPSTKFSGEWKTKRLGELAVVTMGQSPSSTFYNEHGEGLPLIQGNADIERRHTIDRVWTTQASKRCDKDDLLLTVRAPVGYVAIATKDACLGRGVAGLKPTIDHRFLFHALVNAESRWQTLEQGSTFTAASAEQVKQFQLYVPESDSEQRAIAAALSDVDGLLDSLDALIAKKRAVKEAAMQQLLTGRTRLPGFSGEWETKLTGELGKFVKGNGITRADLSDDGLSCVLYGELYTQYNSHITAVKSKIRPEVAQKALQIEAGDLLFTGSGETSEDIGRCAAYLGESIAYVGGDVIVLTLHQGDPRYFGYLMNHSSVSEQEARMGHGGTIAHINAHSLARIQIRVPPLPEQRAIAAVLSDMDDEISALERRREKTEAVKRGMMQELLTGRVRLAEAK